MRKKGSKQNLKQLLFRIEKKKIIAMQIEKKIRTFGVSSWSVGHNSLIYFYFYFYAREYLEGFNKRHLCFKQIY